jgi:hypothetical protein
MSASERGLISAAKEVIAILRSDDPLSVQEGALERLEAATEQEPAVLDEGAAGERDNEPLKTDDTGCVTKRFVIFNRPGMAPEKKGGWLKDEYLIDFLRESMLLDCWTPGFRATVLELTWDNDLWASSASEYLSMHDHAIGPRRAQKAWREARDKHERIYKTPPSMPLGQEIATYHVRTAPSSVPPADEDRVRSEIKAWTDTQFPKSCRVGSSKWVDGLTRRVFAALKSTYDGQAKP